MRRGRANTLVAGLLYALFPSMSECADICSQFGCDDVDAFVRTYDHNKDSKVSKAEWQSQIWPTTLEYALQQTSSVVDAGIMAQNTIDLAFSQFDVTKDGFIDLSDAIWGTSSKDTPACDPKPGNYCA